MCADDHTFFCVAGDWRLKRVSDKYDCDIDFQTFDMATGLYSSKRNALTEATQYILYRISEKCLIKRVAGRGKYWRVGAVGAGGR